MIGGVFVAAWLGFVGPDDARVQAVLADDAYRFCHDPAYPLTADEAAWCPILAAHGSPMCPAFPTTCDAPRAVIEGTRGRLSTRRSESESESEPESNSNSESESESESESASAAEGWPGLGGVAQVLFWAIVLGGVVALVAAIAANSIGRGRGRPAVDEGRASVRPDPISSEAALPGLPTDIETLLRAAEDAERRGDLGLAVDFGHAALLRRLDHEGVLRLHRSRTTGDYLAELRAHPDWRALAAPVLRDIDRAQFRAAGPDAPLTRSILARVAELARAAASTLAIVLVVSVVLACSGFAATAHPWGTSPSGTDALVQLWRQEGRTVRWRTNEVQELDDGGTIVLLEGAAPSPLEWDALEVWVRDRGGVLVVADDGPWPTWIGAQPHGDPYAKAPPRDGSGPLRPGDAYLVVADHIELSAPFSDAGDYAAQHRYGSGRIVVLADSHLLTNAALAVGVTQGLDLVGGYGPIDLVDGWTGEGASSPADSIEGSHLGAAMAQLGVLLLALLLWRGWPFGRGRDPAPPPRRGFTDHARAMGLQYASARASGHAAAAYAGWALEALRRDGGLYGGGLLGLAQAVARRTGRDETEVMRILVEAHDLAERGHQHGDAADDMKLLRELLQLVREGGGRR